MTLAHSSWGSPSSLPHRLIYSLLPIPDDPKKRKTRGCSSSYQPFSFLRIAMAKHTGREDREGAQAHGLAYSGRFSRHPGTGANLKPS